jgi:hypothetical protein
MTHSLIWPFAVWACIEPPFGFALTRISGAVLTQLRVWHRMGSPGNGTRRTSSLRNGNYSVVAPIGTVFEEVRTGR